MNPRDRVLQAINHQETDSGLHTVLEDVPLADLTTFIEKVQAWKELS